MSRRYSALKELISSQETRLYRHNNHRSGECVRHKHTLCDRSTRLCRAAALCKCVSSLCPGSSCPSFSLLIHTTITLVTWETAPLKAFRGISNYILFLSLKPRKIYLFLDMSTSGILKMI